MPSSKMHPPPTRDDKAIVFGAGGHARVVTSLIKHRYAEVTMATTDGGPGLWKESHIYNRAEDFRGHHMYVAIGDNSARRRIFTELSQRGLTPKTCVADNAFVADDAHLGDGVVICPGAVVMTNARVGHNVIINTLSSVDHDCVVGDHSQLAVGVNFAGGTVVGEQCFFGIKSATFPGVHVGEHSVIRGGSLAVKDIPAHVTAGGIPATVLKDHRTNH